MNERNHLNDFKFGLALQSTSALVEPIITLSIVNQYRDARIPFLERTLKNWRAWKYEWLKKTTFLNTSHRRFPLLLCFIKVASFLICFIERNAD